MHIFSKDGQYKYVLLSAVSVIVVLMFNITPTIGEQEVTEAPTSEITSIPVPTETLTPTQTPTNTELPTATVLPTATPTETPTEISPPTDIPTTENIIDVDTTETSTETAAPDALETATGEATMTLVVEVTEAVEATTEMTEEAEVTVEVAISSTPSETTTSTAVTMTLLTGNARYQSRVPDNSGIVINITDENGTLLATAVTDAQGFYVISVPITMFYSLIASAPLHRTVNLQLAPGEFLPQIILAGGDLDGDGCIGAHDIALLTAQFEQAGTTSTDITGNGITDDADLAILAGNYERACGVLVEITATPTSAIPTVATATELSVTPVIKVTEIAEATAEVTVIPEITPEITKEAE